MQRNKVYGFVIVLAFAGLLPVPNARALPTAPPATAWVARYNSIGPGYNGLDSGRALAVDTAGNVYVTGASAIFSNYDYVTIKYNPDGREVWVRRRIALTGTPTAIAVDGAGNVVVTGGSGTIKYDTAGNELWARRYDGPGGQYNVRLALDGAGNVFVTGVSSGATRSDYLTVKYDADGNQRWVARFNGRFSWEDDPEAIRADASGNVHVTGKSVTSRYRNAPFETSEYATIKYDSQGNQLWVGLHGNRYGYEAIDLAVDSAGNVVVTGAPVTLKYDAAGSELWVRSNYLNGFFDGIALAVDSAGNVVVTGRSQPSANAVYATLKYDANGNRLWLAHYSGPVGGARPVALALDPRGNVYVTGTLEGSNRDYGTVAYDANGRLLWSATYNGTSNGQDGAGSLAVDRAGNVYVTGAGQESTPPNPSSDYVTIKYAARPLPLLNKNPTGVR